jgi:hypothetical protein
MEQIFALPDGDLNFECPAGKPWNDEKIVAESQLVTIKAPLSPSRLHHWNIEGPKLWAELHTWARSADLRQVNEWLAEFTEKIWCGSCRQHWRAMLQQHRPPTDSQEALFRWTVDRHNDVNERLNIEPMTYAAADARWPAAA